MSAYYNENDPKAAAWLRELILEGLIAWGDVDERSIQDVKPSELVGYDQCHFFAGIGGWSYALRLAGWPDDKPVWTGSCPCQPFSAAGRGRGFDDPRHLWPAFGFLIDKSAPPVIFGEQVASPAGLAWLDVVLADLESSDYACAAADLCAAGVGAPHIRQRLYWVAHHHHFGREQHAQRDSGAESWLEAGPLRDNVGRCGVNGSVAHAGGERLEEFSQQQARGQRQAAERGGAVGELGDPGEPGSRRDSGAVPRAEGGASGSVRGQSDIAQPASTAGGVADDRLEGRGQVGTDSARCGGGGEAEGLGERPLYSSPWNNAVWIPCRDGKSRPVEPGTFPLAHGVSGRVGLLRGYGNAIVPQVAAAFIEASGLI